MKSKQLLISVLLIFSFTLSSCGVGNDILDQLNSLLPEPAQSVAEAPAAAQEPTAAPTSVPVLDLTGSQDLLPSLYERSIPGVVSIKVSSSLEQGQGTGFVYNADGYIVTNEHVVNGAEVIQVDFNSGYKTYATLIGADKDSDLAVIKVDSPASELTPLPLGDSSALKVGQSVVAIGNPFGLNGTMTLGIISALGRTQESNRESSIGGNFSVAHMIQTDAAINPGNSGGPLFDLNGNVIGINRSITTTSSTLGEPTNSGIGFALPINLVKKVVPAIIQNGKYEYSYMGISTLQSELMSLDVINELDLPQMTGVYVLSVSPDSPADKAGLRGPNANTNLAGLRAGGDLIVAINDEPVRIWDDLIGYLVEATQPGDTITLTVLRGDQTLQLPLTLVGRPE